MKMKRLATSPNQEKSPQSMKTLLTTRTTLKRMAIKMVPRTQAQIWVSISMSILSSEPRSRQR